MSLFPDGLTKRPPAELQTFVTFIVVDLEVDARILDYDDERRDVTV